MKAGIIELGGMCLFGLAALISFGASQSRRPYDLTQIQFCPKSVNGEQGQAELNKRYCNAPRYVLTEEWERYGSYGGIIPYKGDAIMKVKDLPTDNPYQLLGNGVAVVSLWGVTGCLLVRIQRLKQSDYLCSETEKTENYRVWQHELTTRQVQKHTSNLDADITKDIKSQLDLQTRAELGLTDEENEQAKAELSLEDYLKARKAKHSNLDKHIAENLRDAAKANKEREKLELKRNSSSADDGAYTAKSSSEEARKKVVIEQLKDHEDGWLWNVVNAKKPLWVIGEQGSGKSSFATCVCLVRYALFGWKLRMVVDAHGQKNIHDAWKPLADVFPTFQEMLVGSHNNYEAIAQGFLESIEVWAERMGQTPKPDYIQSIYDEMTQLSLQPECKDAAKAFVRNSMSDTRGGRDKVICIAHTFTNAATGDAAGFKELRDKSVVLIERFSEDGEVPRSDAVLRISGEESQVTVPHWFTPSQIAKMLF